MQAPILLKAIPPQLVNERAAYGPFYLHEFIQASEGGLRFQAELVNGDALLKGMICTSDGVLSGIPAKETQGVYEIKLTVENEAGKLETTFPFTVKPALMLASGDYFDELKKQVWSAIDQNLPLPELTELMERPISMEEMLYLLERWGTLTIWDAFNLDPAGEKHELILEGASPHYAVFDRGSCLIACPKDLFSSERTFQDALNTAQAMAREVYKRNWTIELAGFQKMTRAAWVEIQHLGDKHGVPLQILNYAPLFTDLKIYNKEAESLAFRRPE